MEWIGRRKHPCNLQTCQLLTTFVSDDDEHSYKMEHTVICKAHVLFASVGVDWALHVAVVLFEPLQSPLPVSFFEGGPLIHGTGDHDRHTSVNVSRFKFSLCNICSIDTLDFSNLICTCENTMRAV